MPDDKNEETFIVSVVGFGVDIKREVSAEKLALVMSVVMGTQLPVGLSPQEFNADGNINPTKVSLREFLDEAKATTKPDQIVAIGQYMSVHEGKDVFTRDEIKSRFQSARERLPSNFPRDFGTAIAKGLIAEDHAEGGKYYVTKKGIQAVERRFVAQD